MWKNPQKTAELPKEILNEKLYFFWSETYGRPEAYYYIQSPWQCFSLRGLFRTLVRYQAPMMELFCKNS